jgi:CheY-like chemotaxis protein
MPVEIAAHAFEPFFTTKEVGAGSGLGLTQVYGFAQGSGGNATISSVPGEGTVVTLLLPRATQDVQEDVKTVAVPAVRRKTGAVLLVEDDEEVAALTGEMLQQLGFDVTRVASAASALGALANERKVDLVFSDIMMPGEMNGVELARELRRRRPDLPVLLTSGYAADARFEAERDRMTILPKPFDMEDLSVAIAGMMDRAA